MRKADLIERAENGEVIGDGQEQIRKLTKSVPVEQFTDVVYMQRVIIHLYDLLDDISTADDMAKADDARYRKIVDSLQKKKSVSGVGSPDGYGLHISKVEFQTKPESGCIFG